MLFWASYKNSKILVRKQVVELKRGQLCGSISFFMKAWATTKEQVIDFLKILQSEGMIEKKTDKNITIITICNYESYQGGINKNADNLSDSYADSNSENTSDNKSDTNKEVKEIKEINNNNSNAHTREDLPTWEEVRERGFKEAFKQSGQIMALARNCKLNAQEICSYLERYMNERQIIDLGHQDSRHFAKGFKKYVEDEMKKPKPNETPKPRVIEGAAIYNLYK